ncbi:hypothetical protein Har1131_20565 [Haloarcula sp. CBA1131]|uniref:hypothetical protein n=1 Tax=Haloarcula sp. CBA1131 TaxID=1853686 RepID=UPI0012484FF7|nr:hypothetical protein [Haloarcula sp. CBA1131]KAA9401012.1 hypothetical protein Har1131_20565 [Haloarcula sp. CBA1131]
MVQTELAGIMTAEKEEDEGYLDLTGGTQSLVLAKEILPTRGQYEHAWFRVTLTVTDERQDIEPQLEPTISRHEFRGQADAELEAIRFLHGDSIQGYIGFNQFCDTPASPDSDWDPTDCYVTIQVAYDPGLTCKRTTFLKSDRSPDPALGYITEFPQLDLQVDYRGHIVGTEIEQRFPKAIEYCLPVSNSALVVLDPDSEGTADAGYEYETGRNLLAIKPTGEIAWTVDQVTNSHDTVYIHTYPWRVSTRVFSKLRSLSEGPNIIAELDPETGEVITVDI